MDVCEHVCVCARACVRVWVVVAVGGKSGEASYLFVGLSVATRMVDRTCKCGTLQRETAARLQRGRATVRHEAV